MKYLNIKCMKYFTYKIPNSIWQSDKNIKCIDFTFDFDSHIFI